MSMVHQEILKEFKGRGQIQNVVQTNKLLSEQAQKVPYKKLMSCTAPHKQFLLSDLQ